MERRNLKEARRKAKLSQPELADKIGVSTATVSLWERGQQDPQPYQVRVLCDFFGIDNPGDLLKIENDQGKQEDFRIPVEEFFSQCTAALSGCWQLMQHKGFDAAQNIVKTNMPRLAVLCQEGKYLDKAASLASQANILEAILAMHRLDYAAREAHCIEAVRYGGQTRDHRIYAASLMYQAYTYTYCYPRDPEKATELFKQALGLLDEEACLLESDICMGLAVAYAQCKEETKALDTIERSIIVMPPYPEQDASYSYADCDLSDHYLWQGRTYINLSTHFTGKRYAEKAYDSFLMSASLGTTRERTTSEIAIHQADAALALGDLDHFVESLGRGVRIAKDIGSKKRYSEAVSVLRKAPREWREEQKYKDLSELFAPGA